MKKDTKIIVVIFALIAILGAVSLLGEQKDNIVQWIVIDAGILTILFTLLFKTK